MMLTKLQRKMLELIREQKRITVAELSREFEVTEASIRLDLTDLENKAFVQRFHGGARIVQPSIFDTKTSTNLSEKTKIAQRAVAHIQEGEALFLDSGTTVMLLAKELSAVENLTIITNSPPLLALLGPEPNKRIVLIGGEYSRENQCCCGTMTEKELEGVFVSKVFMGADSVDIENGAIFADLRNLGYIQKIIANTKQVILLSDSSKFTRIRGMKIAELSQVHLIITDPGLPPDQQDGIRRMGISLEIAGDTRTMGNTGTMAAEEA